MSLKLYKKVKPETLLTRLIDNPNLIMAIQNLNPQDFSSIVRDVGVEDAVEIVAFSTTEQLVAAFDEDLFVNSAPGERETFSPLRFIIWLEVLLEAGEDEAAIRITELSFDFVVNAVNSLILVLDNDALLVKMNETYEDVAEQIENALESALLEEIDGYFLISRIHEGWDAVMALILELDKNHRSYLERLLDRCCVIGEEYIDDLDALYDLLTLEESLADDVEAERDERRGKLGYVEPRNAKAFLELSKLPLPINDESKPVTRDYITESHFRSLNRQSLSGASVAKDKISSQKEEIPLLPVDADSKFQIFLTDAKNQTEYCNTFSAFIEGLHDLKIVEPTLFDRRMEELAYLSNVLLAGATYKNKKLRPADATEAAVSTVAFGVEIEFNSKEEINSNDVIDILTYFQADILYRKACNFINHQNDFQLEFVPNQSILSKMANFFFKNIQK
ncbi:MAG: hypothetical protein JXR91_08530 [Deltaproteobacteria bacterium]|nr:hypothetical protein [Deltaproteobacteria bacterium]